jgi:hypothetical protein
MDVYNHTDTDIRIIFTCHTPTIALAMRISNITKGSTKAVIWSSCSSNRARTCNERSVRNELENFLRNT